jgi:mRNA-degrading endonuclease toxin of MazEF toxin-antitoxin module
VRQWEIYLFPFEKEKPHPAVIISNDERCLNGDLDYANALICTSAKVSREAKKNEVILNGADGLDWKTAVRCDVIYLLPKAEFKEQRGKVTPARRVTIARKIAETLRLQMS